MNLLNLLASQPPSNNSTLQNQRILKPSQELILDLLTLEYKLAKITAYQEISVGTVKAGCLGNRRDNYNT